MPPKVLSKSFKIVPIMVMGKILGNKEYPFYDYVVAGIIALGITLFLVRVAIRANRVCPTCGEQSCRRGVAMIARKSDADSLLARLPHASVWASSFEFRDM